MPDILIYVSKEARDEDRGDFLSKIGCVPELDKDWEFYWSFTHSPIRIRKNKDMVMFTDGKNVIAEGLIIDFDETNIYFKSLSKVNYPQPKKAPTRGFTYVEGVSN